MAAPNDVGSDDREPAPRRRTSTRPAARRDEASIESGSSPVAEASADEPKTTGRSRRPAAGRSAEEASDSSRPPARSSGGNNARGNDTSDFGAGLDEDFGSSISTRDNSRSARSENTAARDNTSTPPESRDFGQEQASAGQDSFNQDRDSAGGEGRYARDRNRRPPRSESGPRSRSTTNEPFPSDEQPAAGARDSFSSENLRTDNFRSETFPGTNFPITNGGISTRDRSFTESAGGDFSTRSPGDGEQGGEGFQSGRSGGFHDGDDSGDQSENGRRRRRRRRRGRGTEGGPQGPAPAAPRGQFVPQNNNGPRGRNNGPGRPQGGGQRHQGGNRPYDQQRRSGPQGGAQHTQGAPYSSAPRGPEVIEPTTGILELHPKGYGFLRDPKAGYVSQESDPFVSTTLIQKYLLREGVQIQGDMIQGSRGQGPRLKTVDYIDGRTPEEYVQVKSFDELTPINPFEQIRLETGPTPITMRIMDLLTPIGKGQRALIVAPPRSGKTMLLQEIADSVSKNHPEIYLIVLLIDERPEEVTEMRRRVRGDVIASSMDREVENHVRVSQLIFERAKRLTEAGRDVFILLDSITRTARAFNKWTGNTGRTMSGGLDIKAMDIPKKMFGQARRFEEGGSLTVVGTALVETGSKMDDVIFQEFKGTGNMEMVLSRDLADRRIWPAIDVSKSGTRREEKILSPEVLEGVTLLRRSLISLSSVEAMEQMVRILTKYKTNEEFLAKVRSIL
ncbi:MAG: transcription termination factor Rho [Planctomyces sp.]|nr:transcription termination factor Rho [Planctomyces sp.]